MSVVGDVFAEHRDHLVGVAYRMLGELGEAEDVAQEAFLRWERAGPDTIESPRAWLTTVTGRLALDRLRSAQARRERYVGPWLPEPVALDDDDPAGHVELADSITMAFLVVLERLGPVERAVFVLHEVFDYDYREIAEIVDRSEAACRQIASRARRRVAEERPPRFPVEQAEEKRVTEAFLVAVASGDIDAVIGLLAPDIVHLSDGGGVVHAARRPIVGAPRVARLFVNLAKRVPRDATVAVERWNGQPAVVVRDRDRITLVMTITVGDGLVQATHAVVNPEKLPPPR